jgi:hypothetical protein
MNTQKVKALGGVEEELHFTMDYDLFVKLRRLGEFKYIDSVLCTALAQPNAKTVQFMTKLWAEKIELYKVHQIESAIPNLERRIKNNADWNYVIPPLRLKQLADISDEHTYLPLQSRCRNGSATPGSFITIYADFRNDPAQTLTQIKDCAEILLSRLHLIQLKIFGPNVEEAQKFLQHDSLIYTSQLDTDRKSNSFCQSIIVLDTFEQLDLSILTQGLNFTIPIVSSPRVLKNLKLETGKHGFSANSTKEIAFKTLQISMEPSVWGNMTSHLLLKETNSVP